MVTRLTQLGNHLPQKEEPDYCSSLGYQFAEGLENLAGISAYAAGAAYLGAGTALIVPGGQPTAVGLAGFGNTALGVAGFFSVSSQVLKVLSGDSRGFGSLAIDAGAAALPGPAPGPDVTGLIAGAIYDNYIPDPCGTQ